MTGDTIHFIRNYHVSYHSVEDHLESAGFSHILYLVFQGFKQDLDAFLAESINPAIIRFVREQENRTIESLKAAVGSYHVMVRNVLAGYDGMMKTLAGDGSNPGAMPDMDFKESLSGLSFPPVAASLRYSARIKADAALRLGFYTLVGIMKKIFKKSAKNSRQEKIMALEDGVKRMKLETETAIAFQFKNYRENLKFQYIFKLADAVSGTIYDTLVARFQIYATDLTQLLGLLDKQGGERESALKMLEAMSRTTQRLMERIDRAREDIGTIGR